MFKLFLAPAISKISENIWRIVHSLIHQVIISTTKRFWEPIFWWSDPRLFREELRVLLSFIQFCPLFPSIAKLSHTTVMATSSDLQPGSSDSWPCSMYTPLSWQVDVKFFLYLMYKVCNFYIPSSAFSLDCKFLLYRRIRDFLLIRIHTRKCSLVIVGTALKATQIIHKI